MEEEEGLDGRTLEEAGSGQEEQIYSLMLKEFNQAKGLSMPIGMRCEGSFFFVAIDLISPYGLRPLFAWVRDVVVFGPSSPHEQLFIWYIFFLYVCLVLTLSVAVMFYVLCSLSEARLCIITQPKRDTETCLNWGQRNA